MIELNTRLFFGIGTTRPILHATDLIHHQPKKRRHHYRNGYSMAEGARCWVAASGYLPRSMAQVVGGDTIDTAHFEYPVKVWGGGTSMTDITAFTPDDVIAVEGKACETFDEKIIDWIHKEGANNCRFPPHRLRVINRYARALGVRVEAMLELRYQLLHRTLASALLACEYHRRGAWMLVQSFAPLDCDEHARNRADFDRYVALVGNAPVLEGVPVTLPWVDEVM